MGGGRGGRGARSCWGLVCMVVGMACCATSPPPGDQIRAHLLQEVAGAVDDLPSIARSAVVSRLLKTAHGMLEQGDAMHALRVLALCRRLEPGSADLAIAIADMQCRAGDFPGAHAGFRLALALARQTCRNVWPQPTGQSADRAQDCSATDIDQAKELIVASSARHGMCLMEARRFDKAAARFREALAVSPVRRRCSTCRRNFPALLCVQFSCVAHGK